MKRAPLPILTCLLLFAVPLCAQRGPGRVRWAQNGESLQVGGVQLDPLTGERTATPEVARPESDPSDAEFGAALTTATGAAVPRDVLLGSHALSTLPRAPEPRPGMAESADGAVRAVVLDDALWTWHRGEPAKKVASGLKDVRHFEMSPDGRAVSYIQDFDLYVARTDSGETFRLTDDGSDQQFNGELDWVYQEEVYGRYDFDATWWSPDGAGMAFLRIDETGVDTFTVVDHIPNQLALEPIRYPKAGTTNPRATLLVARPDRAETVAVDLSKYPPDNQILIVRVGWTPDAKQIVYLVQDREQTWLDLNVADPATGKSRTILRETCADGWVERLPMPVWLADGSFLWESDRTGYRHIYRYRPDGELVATLTHGEWTVRDTIRLDEKGGWIAVSGSIPGYAIGEHAWRAALDGSSLVQLTQDRGTHDISFNADGSLFIDSFQSLENPGEQWLRKADGTAVRQLAARESRADAVLPHWQQIKARDGETLDVVYVLPENFDETGKYPVWLDTYSGPDTPSIHDRWQGNGRPTWYVRFSVNVRTASGRGMKFTKQCFHQFGVQELKDLEDAVDWLCKERSWADASRVGISGWSYGGFMTAFAMTHSDRFKCGIAGGGVYNWELYDTIYTERYMGLPQTDPAGYARSSILAAAKDLKGELLIVHGTMDDNVHLQNAIQFVLALEEANQQNFQLMLYPESRHGVSNRRLGRHLAGLADRFRRANL